MLRQGPNGGLVFTPAVRQQAQAVTPRHEMHAPVLYRGVLKRDPEMYCVEGGEMAGVCLVLMPRCFSLVERPLVYRMVERIPQPTTGKFFPKLLTDCKDVCPSQPRLDSDRTVNLRTARLQRVPAALDGGEILNHAFGQFIRILEQWIKQLSHLIESGDREHVRQSNEPLRLELRYVGRR